MFGLQFTNDTTGELILSDQAPLYRYIGRATLTGITQDTNVGVGDREAGESTYQITSEYSIVPVVALRPGYSTLLKSFVRSGNTWTIKVSQCLPNSNTPTAQFQTQVEAEVYVFAAPLPYITNTYGAAIYDNNGNVIGDLSQAPLTFRQRIYIADGQSWVAVGSGVKPGIIGFGKTTRRDGVGSGGSGREVFFYNCWELSSDGTQLRPAMTIDYTNRLTGDDANNPPPGWPRPTVVNYRPGIGILLNLNAY